MPTTLMHDNTNNHLCSFGMIECIVFEHVRVRMNAPPFRSACASNSSQFQICDGG
jgi:hypothetical protein